MYSLKSSENAVKSRFATKAVFKKCIQYSLKAQNSDSNITRETNYHIILAKQTIVKK